MGQIAGKAPVKPCAPFCSVGGIILHGRDKGRYKCLCVAHAPPGKTKALHPQQMQGKRKAPPRGRGGDYLFFSSRSARAEQSSCASSSVRSYSARSWSASALLHPPSYRAAALLETSFNMIFPLFRAFALFYSISYRRPQKQDLQKYFCPFGLGRGCFTVQPR